MANVAHASLTGSELHEPKGADTAGLGTVYVADGAGSGSWNSIGTSAFTGMIADFAAPVAPAGWLELDGSVISTATYSGLFAVMSMTSSGTRTNGSPVITSVPDTSTFKAGYYVFGTGIATALTILSVDSPTQITLSGNASSSGTSSFFVSPWLMNTGTVKLPDLTTAGRYRRSRTSSTKVGDALADQNKAHTHNITGDTGNQSASHYHNVFGTSGNNNQDHFHTYAAGVLSPNQTGGGAFSAEAGATTTANTSNTSGPHNHGINIDSGIQSQSHHHSMNFTSGSSGETEARPLTLVVLTCIKT